LFSKFAHDDKKVV